MFLFTMRKTKRFSTYNCDTYCSSNREVQVTLITTKEELPNKEQFIAEVQKQMPAVKSIMQNVNWRKTSVIFGDKTFKLAEKK